MRQRGKDVEGALLAAAAVALIFGAAACTTTPPPADWPAPAEPKLVLQSGDTLKIKFPYWPELDMEQAIRPDGKIALDLVGDVKAEGQTPDELRAQLLVAYQDKLNNPEITVVVTSFDSHRVYVGGEVKTPGIVMMKGPLTILAAIMQSGGFNKGTAKLANVVVVRERDGKQFAQSLDLRKALELSESTPFYLEPGDVVFVPRTAIDRLDQWVDQYINQIVPKNVHYTFSQFASSQKTKSETLQVQVSPIR
jgi:protein involved in polysaccharide export with SLBB domain